MLKINYNLIAWVEGAAIAAAVFLVASVGSFVDWRKEVEFVRKRTESNKKNVVSKLKIEFVTHAYSMLLMRLCNNFGVVSRFEKWKN